MRKLYFFLTLLIFIVPFNKSFSFEINTGISRNIQAFVNGRVLDEKGFPIPYAKVIVRDKETQTDVSGKFSILNIEVPFDVTIAERKTSTAVIYKNVSISNPDLIFFGYTDDDNSNFINSKITFPKIPEGSTGIIKFISKDIFKSKEVKLKTGDSLIFLDLSWPIFQNYLKGEIVFILKNENGFQTVKFKTVTYNKNSNKEVKINSKPGKKLETSEVNIYFPEVNYETKGFSISADLFDYNKNSGINFYENETNNNQFKVQVPDKIPNTFKLKLTGYVNNKDGSGFVNYLYISPGATVKIESESPPEIQTPSDKILAVDGNTRFSYSNGTGAGIYVLEFISENPQLKFYIVTGERETKLNYLSRSEFKSGSVDFRWSVMKYLTYFNVDEFVKPAVFKNDFTYKAILFSKERSFKTGYR